MNTSLITKSAATLALTIITMIGSITLNGTNPAHAAPATVTVSTAANVMAIDTMLPTGNWHWGSYRFNKWETDALANWTPWAGGRSEWVAETVLDIVPGAVYASWGLMLPYRTYARWALSQNQCLNVYWFGTPKVGPCGR